MVEEGTFELGVLTRWGFIGYLGRKAIFGKETSLSVEVETEAVMMYSGKYVTLALRMQ